MSASTVLTNKQGSVVSCQSDMILVRYDGKGVLFRKNVMTRQYKNDEIVQFSAKKATTVDKEVGDRLCINSGYQIEWLGTEIKFIKTGRIIRGEGAVLAVPDSQYMFVDWRFTLDTAPKAAVVNGRAAPTNVYVTRASTRPDTDDMHKMFKQGDRVKYVAREQAPNERGVCWRAIVATDVHHEIAVDTPTAYCRNNFKVIPKAGAAPPAKPIAASAPKQPAWVPNYSPTPTVQKPLTQNTPIKAPIQKTTTGQSDYQIQKPPPVDGFDYFDTSPEACAARFRKFAENYRRNNPACLFSKLTFEDFLKMKYLQQIGEELTAIQAAQS